VIRSNQRELSGYLQTYLQHLQLEGIPLGGCSRVVEMYCRSGRGGFEVHRASREVFSKAALWGNLDRHCRFVPLGADRSRNTNFTNLLPYQIQFLPQYSLQIKGKAINIVQLDRKPTSYLGYIGCIGIT
jgi:hypothetical protein